MLALAAPARLISDLHLHAQIPVVAERFASFVDDCIAHRIGSLCILGDLFEYWIGDDQLADPFAAAIAAHLRKLADSGVAVHFLSGNRDFLIGQRFADAARLALRHEPLQVTCCGHQALLLHGDALCTDDEAYQAFRAKVRDPAWQAAFLAMPIDERLAAVTDMRARSREAQQHKAEEIMDVNVAAVCAAMQTAGTRLLIHGHTHRPGTERFALGNGIAERWVLSDWTETRGDAIEIDAAGIRRLTLTTSPAAPD